MASNLMNSSGALPIRDIIEGRTFRIPLYQRNYKWGKDIAKKLATDLFESKEKGIKKSIGLLTLHQRGDIEYDIIDGQQRFITLSIIFSLLDEEVPIELSFERDNEEKTRRNAIYGTSTGSSTDEDRIKRNKEDIRAALGNLLDDEELKKDFWEYILNNCVMLCSVVESSPEKEFMNLNAYKTSFSVCDYVRANLISLNTFYRQELEEKNSILASCLEKHTYKTAIAYLYDDILNILYSAPQKDGTYQSVFSAITGFPDPPEKDKTHQKNAFYLNPDATKESRINILFSTERSTKEGYFSDEINKNVEDWIQMLLKIACAKKLLAQLEQEMQKQNFSSAKQIDDYQKLKQKNFLDLVMGIDVEKEGLNTITLAKLLKENSNVGYVLMKELEITDRKLANRYFESFVYSSINKATVTSAEHNDGIALPRMSDNEIVSCIQGAGQYVIARFLDEQKRALDASVSIAPVLDLEDSENPEFGGKLDLEDDGTIKVGELFKNSFKIPVIQRDYCMGARIAKAKGDDFLGYLLKNFKDDQEVIVSTILISVEKGSNDIYIFDGQQRSYTIYQILKYCNKAFDKNGKKFTFIGRREETPSKYSEVAVNNLREALGERLNGEDTEAFRKFIEDKVRFKVQIAGKVSDAEQFFMDINGGVSLKKYEIFKSCLSERLKKLKKEDFIKKLENEWLKWFYDFLGIKETDESDIEELIEMRFIEFLCRFFIRKRSGVDRKSFDCIDSKSELVGELKYLDNLSEDDIVNICKVMKYLTNPEHTIKNPCDKLSIDRHGEYFFIDSYDERHNDRTSICWYSLTQIETDRKKFIDSHKNYILHKFIHSLSDKKREHLKEYYSWKTIETLIKIYDKDELIGDCIQHILEPKKELGSEPYPYAEKRAKEREIKMRFCGGYRNGIKEDPNFIPERELPAYYVESLPSGYCVRANYLYDKIIEKHPELKDKKDITLDFILTGREYFESKEKFPMIKKENGLNTYIAFWRESAMNSSLEMKPGPGDFAWQEIKESSGEVIAELTNRTDAYLLKSRGVLSNLI